jgi:hypothetical protein
MSLQKKYIKLHKVRLVSVSLVHFPGLFHLIIYFRSPVNDVTTCNDGDDSKLEAESHSRVIVGRVELLRGECRFLRDLRGATFTNQTYASKIGAERGDV